MNALAPGATGRRFLGVDVGISGAIAVIDEANNHYVTEPAPEIATLSVASITARYRQTRELASCTFKISRAGM